jgi:hypothetical protein
MEKCLFVKMAFLQGYSAKRALCAFIESLRAGFWRSNPRSGYGGIASSQEPLLATTGRLWLRHLAFLRLTFCGEIVKIILSENEPCRLL